MFLHLKDRFLVLLKENSSEMEDPLLGITTVFMIFLEEKISSGEICVDEEGEPNYSEVKKKYDFLNRATTVISNTSYFINREETVSKVRRLFTCQELYNFLDEIGEEIYTNINFNESDDRYINKDICSLLAFEIISLNVIVPFLNDTSITEINSKCDIFKDRYKADYFEYEDAIFLEEKIFLKFMKTLNKNEKSQILLLKEKAEECYLKSIDYKQGMSSKELRLIDRAELFNLRYMVNLMDDDKVDKAMKKNTKDYENLILEKYYLAIDEINEIEIMLAEYTKNMIEDINYHNIEDISDFVNLSLQKIISFVSKNAKQINTSLESIEVAIIKYMKLISVIEQRLSNKNSASNKFKIIGIIEESKEKGYFWMWDIIEKVKEVTVFYIEHYVSTVIDNHKSYLCKNNIENVSISIKDDEIRQEINQILSYKKLNKIAKDKGFEKIRQNGDHGIFKKSDGSIVVIPQGRAIGKGLNIKIQKELS